MKKNSFVGKTFITNNFEETQKLGKDFAEILEKGDVVCLYGDLGSGKTTFVQGLAVGLGIKKRIISPTFVIVRSYKIRINDEGLRIDNFYHIDLYRTNSERDIEGLGIEEIINNKNNIVVIEWAEKLKNQMPAKRIDVNFFYENESKRKINFSLGF
jgi:tRNA threonylcarbamoyladenosine biosynthesis protein TsaE